MWELFGLAKATGRAPSEVLGITDEVAAFHLDRAVTYFGNTVENAIHEAVNDAKNKTEALRKSTMTLNKYLGIQRFRDPASGGAKRVST